MYSVEVSNTDGVPEIEPVPVLNASPAGNNGLIENVKGDNPPTGTIGVKGVAN